MGKTEKLLKISMRVDSKKMIIRDLVTHVCYLLPILSLNLLWYFLRNFYYWSRWQIFYNKKCDVLFFQELIEDIPVNRISYCTADPNYPKVFALIARERGSRNLFTHVFLTNKKEMVSCVTFFNVIFSQISSYLPIPEN
jgi:Phosphotyrosine interaction domain (PTB/PID).